jgi:intracellular septation protein
MSSERRPPIFLLSFIPAVAYWLLETYSTLGWALAGGMLLGLIEMAVEKKLFGHVHTVSKLNVGLILVLGSLSLWASEGLWFKLQPTFTGAAIAAFLVFKKLKGESLMLQMLDDFKQRPPLPAELYFTLETHLCAFLVFFAVFMAHVAVNESTATWLFWKTGGFYLAFGGFMLVEYAYLRWRIKR